MNTHEFDFTDDASFKEMPSKGTLIMRKAPTSLQDEFYKHVRSADNAAFFCGHEQE